MLHRAHRELHNASNNERVAAEQVTELKQANKLFGGFRNPFRSKSKLERAAMAKAQAETQADVHAHSEMRRSEYQSKRQTVAAGSTGTNSAISGRGSAAHGFASSAIESDLMDEEDRAHEREIDESLYEMGSLVGNLRAMAVNMNTEVRAQNEVIGKLGNKSDDLHVRLATTHSRVKNIK